MEEIESVMSNSNYYTEISLSDIATIISAICALISVIAIVVLIKERQEKSRPYLQISLELVRAELACIVIRNVGNVGLTLTSLCFDNVWIEQLPDMDIRSRLKDKKQTKINIFPDKLWVICLEDMLFNVINYKNPVLNISYKYTKVNDKKEYHENIIIDFSEYKTYLSYISETDELRKSIDKLTSEIKKIKK